MDRIASSVQVITLGEREGVLYMEKAKYRRKLTPAKLLTFLPTERSLIYCVKRLSRVNPHIGIIIKVINLNFIFLDVDPDSSADVTRVLSECFP